MSKDIKYTDILIVGAGPSGCMAASILRDSGKSVILLDKNDFPRHKPCAGGLTPKTVEELPFEITGLKQHDSEKMLFKFTNGKTVDLNNESGACKMVVREEFDEFFFNYVKNKGAEFIKGKVIKIKETANEVSVETPENQIKCKYLIGADGANSTVRRLTTDLKFKNPVFAFEGLVDRKLSFKDIPTKFVFNKLGYGWIFPKKDHYNVGIGNLVYDSSQPKPRKNDLFSFVKDELGADEIKHITGFPIGTEGNQYFPKSMRTYLVGDAAGLAETLLGEGIYNAVISGKYIANSIVGTHNPEDVYNKYSIFLLGMKKELALYKRASMVLYKKQRMSYWMLKLFFGKKFMDGYSEGKTLTEIIKGKYPFPST
jgi:geranylgeranyl reductase family protein